MLAEDLDLELEGALVAPRRAHSSAIPFVGSAATSILRAVETILFWLTRATIE